MRKLLVLLLSIVMVFCLSGCVLEEISLLYSDTGEKDGFFIAVNETADCCFVGGYNCVEYTENMEIIIPDDYEDIPIKRIGGYCGRGVPTPFGISLADLYINAPQGTKYHSVFQGDIADYMIEENYTVKNVEFDLYIGKNIETIEFISMNDYYPHINEDNSITFYHPVVSVTCSEENKFFYSKDGKLYSKSSDELITDFSYAE